MFDHLIRKYRYIGDKTPSNVRKRSILKCGQFRETSFDLNGQVAFGVQKKKTDNKNLNGSPTSITESASIAEISPTQSSKNNKYHTRKSDLDIDGLPGELQSPEAIRESIEAEIKAEYETRLKETGEKSYNDGFLKGKEDGFTEGISKVKEVELIIANIVKEINKTSDNYFEEFEHILTDLSVYLAQKIIGEAVSAVPDIIKTNVEKCIELIAGVGNVTVNINPADYETVRGFLPELDQKHEGKYSLIIEPDKNILRGGCLVEINGSVIDGRIDTQLQKLKHHLEMLI